jgi:hypothetical protein
MSDSKNAAENDMHTFKTTYITEPHAYQQFDLILMLSLRFTKLTLQNS